MKLNFCLVFYLTVYLTQSIGYVANQDSDVSDDYDSEASEQTNLLTEIEIHLLKKLLDKFEQQRSSKNTNSRIHSARLAQILKSENFNQNYEIEDLQNPSSSNEINEHVNDEHRGNIRFGQINSEYQNVQSQRAKNLLSKLIDLKKKIQQAKANGKFKS
jgi:hypothetical protein